MLCIRLVLHGTNTMVTETTCSGPVCRIQHRKRKQKQREPRGLALVGKWVRDARASVQSPQSPLPQRHGPHRPHLPYQPQEPTTCSPTVSTPPSSSFPLHVPCVSLYTTVISLLQTFLISPSFSHCHTCLAKPQTWLSPTIHLSLTFPQTPEPREGKPQSPNNWSVSLQDHISSRRPVTPVVQPPLPVGLTSRL